MAGKQITLVLDEKMKAQVEEAAGRRYQTVSEWIRAAMVDRLGAEKTP